MTSSALTIRITDLTFSWEPQGPVILSIENLTVKAGTQTLITGPSGSGKTSLLNILSGVTVPTTGSVEILGQEMTALNAQARDKFRADRVGVIFQMFNLLPYLSILENVMLSCMFSSERRTAALDEGGAEAQARYFLDALQLSPSEFGGRPVNTLSIGQQQRVAVARALIGNPGLVIADEPTSALDARNREMFLNLISKVCKENNTTLIVVSHDEALFKHFDHRIDMETLNSALPMKGMPA